MLEWRFHDSPQAGWLFINILLKANWKAGYFQGEVVPRGTLATSVRKLSEDTGISLNTVRKYLKEFEKEGMIETKVFNHATFIKVLNYAKYQGREFYTDTPVDTQLDTPNDTHVDTVNDTVSDTHVDTLLDTVIDTQLEPNRRKKESKNININNISIHHQQADDEVSEPKTQSEIWFESFWDLYPKKVSKKNAEKKFLKICTSEKKFNEIMEGLKRTVVKKAEFDKTTQYVPNPDTWLNGERWNDPEYIPPERNSSGGSFRQNEHIAIPLPAYRLNEDSKDAKWSKEADSKLTEQVKKMQQEERDMKERRRLAEAERERW